MPYTELSPFAAAVGAAAGYAQGKQAQQQRELEQQRYREQMAQQAAAMALDQRRTDDEERRIKDEETNAADDRAARNRVQQISEGIDPNTGKPIRAELPTSLTRGKINSNQATPQQQYEHAMKVATFFSMRGFKEQAQPFFDDARTIAEQMRQGQIFDQDMKKLAVTIAATGQRETTNENARFAHDVQLRGMPTYADLHPRPGALRAQTPAELNTMLNEWSNGHQTQTGTDIVNNSPIYQRVPPPSDQQQFVYSAVSQIQGSRNPAAAAALAITAFRKHFKNADPQAIRILQTAANTAAGGYPSPPPP